MHEQLKNDNTGTKSFGISTRTLRYYKQLGLIKGQRIEGYSYRVKVLLYG